MKDTTLNGTGLKPVLNWGKPEEIGSDVYHSLSVYCPLTNMAHNFTVCHRNRVVNRMYAYVDDHCIDGFETIDDGKVECEKYFLEMMKPVSDMLRVLSDHYTG